MPVALDDLPVIAATGNADRTTLLLPRTHAVGERRGSAGMVELRRRLVEPAAPAVPAVHGDDRALVAGERDDARISGVDPDVLVVVAAGCPPQGTPCPAAIGGFGSDDAGAVHDVGIQWIDRHNGQIPAADTQRRPRVRGDSHPVLARIIGTEDTETGCRGIVARLARADDSVEPLRIARRDCNVDLGQIRGQAARQSPPARAAVSRFEQPTAGTFELVLVFP